MEDLESQREENENPNPPPPWVELPDDVTASILQRLGAVEILETAQNVCTDWRRVCKLPSMWRIIDMRNAFDINHQPHKLEIMCRDAVDRSEGQFVDINIQNFGTDELLLYIGERSKHLKCLKLTCLHEISRKGLVKASERFPELEELKVTSIIDLNDKDIEKIGTSCPKLKSFTWYTMEYSMQGVTNDSALAIAKSMPNLHHLGLIGAGLDHEGLKAILDGCPHLESLDFNRFDGVSIRSLNFSDKSMYRSAMVDDDIDSYVDFVWREEEVNNGYIICY